MNHLRFLSYVVVSFLSVVFSSYVTFQYSKIKISKIESKHEKVLIQIANDANQAQLDEIKKYQIAQNKIAKLDSALLQEQRKNEKLSKDYRARLAAGDERLRVTVRNCSNSDKVRTDSTSAKLGNDSTTYADLDPKIAESIFRVAEEDQFEIDKLKALQAYLNDLLISSKKQAIR